MRLLSILPKSSFRFASFWENSVYRDEQVRSIAAALAGDLEAADRVELDLPETGVCGIGADSAVGAACCGAAPKVSVKETPEPTAACCGGPAAEGVEACCVKDADAKASGKAGCGCSSSPNRAEVPAQELVGAQCCG